MFRRAVADGLELRQFEFRDAEILFTMVDRDRAYLRQWLPWVDGTRSADHLRDFLLRVTAQFEDGLGPNFGIWLEGALAGSIGCHLIDLPNRSCSLGYWIAAGCQGRGIITRCCRHLLDYLFDELGLHRVEIRCGTGNTRSGAIPRRLGFRREGVLLEAEWVNDRWLDLEVWSMLEQDWRSARQSQPVHGSSVPGRQKA
jgi:ribosomal-protein-serine acetyltransferase